MSKVLGLVSIGVCVVLSAYQVVNGVNELFPLLMLMGLVALLLLFSKSLNRLLTILGWFIYGFWVPISLLHVNKGVAYN